MPRHLKNLRRTMIKLRSVHGLHKRDVVHHLTTWLPGLLGSCGVELPVGALDDPVGSWATQDTAVRWLLAERGAEEITHAFLGTKSIGDLLAQIYIPEPFSTQDTSYLATRLTLTASF